MNHALAADAQTLYLPNANTGLLLRFLTSRSRRATLVCVCVYARKNSLAQLDIRIRTRYSRVLCFTRMEGEGGAGDEERQKTAISGWLV